MAGSVTTTRRSRARLGSSPFSCIICDMTAFLGRSFIRLYAWACQRLYHELAPAYEAVAWLVSAGRWAGWRRAVIPQLRGRRVLELGCGTGRLLRALLEAGFAAWGIDPSPAMARQAAGALRGLPAAKGRILRACAEALPFSAGAFDSVLLTFPSGYILAPATAEEIHRAVRAGGCLAIVDGWVLPVPAGRAAGSLPYEAAIVAAGFRIVWRERLSAAPYGVQLVVAEKYPAAGDYP